ncbi:hypothetical protein PLICRDRAFT_181268 [Plicaturopsis crispa FD-325 SS-3]|uniref:Unplaced genomic scaffold PLICRscaffold_310, whole genome shotgun sequence n=1 Tax=Plicaturopsis crispa FD-325 SS-3 TaxID=944288 RepID=A0A0C9T0I4_PLICR|nr:hypothetical protein PLICRDRAFT_181268 [Plicaturopsis crispa FD-325 SS-3]
MAAYIAIVLHGRLPRNPHPPNSLHARCARTSHTQAVRRVAAVSVRRRRCRRQDAPALRDEQGKRRHDRCAIHVLTVHVLAGHVLAIHVLAIHVLAIHVPALPVPAPHVLAHPASSQPAVPVLAPTSSHPAVPASSHPAVPASSHPAVPASSHRVPSLPPTSAFVRPRTPRPHSPPSPSLHPRPRTRVLAPRPHPYPQQPRSRILAPRVLPGHIIARPRTPAFLPCLCHDPYQRALQAALPRDATREPIQRSDARTATTDRATTDTTDRTTPIRPNQPLM